MQIQGFANRFPIAGDQFSDTSAKGLPLHACVGLTGCSSPSSMKSVHGQAIKIHQPVNMIGRFIPVRDSRL